LRFCQFLECQAPPHKPKAPAETQSPPIENFLATVLVGTRKQFKRGADIDSPPVQHSLRKGAPWPTAQASQGGRRRPLETLVKKVQKASINET